MKGFRICRRGGIGENWRLVRGAGDERKARRGEKGGKQMRFAGAGIRSAWGASRSEDGMRESELVDGARVGELQGGCMARRARVESVGRVR